ncbi:uncharacterized protein Z520_01995 [Fonsecaea multimorphosa CBS 102226]|uniref:Uncharacterized protein n=1 Tax=Fonsecaea multimorphosa CBS 102226 TaxID=1442371 RepID=A0A0D2IXV7_9EURO|nr:uncharacterized protein Z520_01995 [Fonsecaea multimorphosa CBS 102226]KIY01857.1 hypothetical protein Z520_01995 [Fonsecaea multimorphosa CBS 102226]OAL29541.1 hypothetical protein AYO22_01955 [Fonsecaea multimorphosa]
MPAQDPQKPPPTRHVILPFDLRNDANALYDPEKRDAIRSIFPGTIGIGSDGWFLYLQVHTLPPKPWPLTVAGLPLYLHQIPGQNPMPRALPVSRKNGSIAEDQNGRDMQDWEPLFHIIKSHFEELRVPITEVMYLGNVVFIVLKYRDTNYNKLPFHAANISCSYLFEDEMGRPSAPHVRRLSDRAPGDLDMNQYDTLQPGLRVASSYLLDKPDAFLATTTGVLLKDRVGNEFMTVAAHGFPSECGTRVFHAFPSTGRDVGELVMEVSHTDIALVKLRDTETFSNVMFHDELIEQPTQLNKFISAKKYRRSDSVYLRSPNTGFIEGRFSWSSFQAVPGDDYSSKQEWIFTTWSYLGQDSAIKLHGGMCGSTIWDEAGNVLGFFRYAPEEGVMKDWCAATAADELINQGYTLVNTSDRA